jgi:hypothetical protein
MKSKLFLLIILSVFSSCIYDKQKKIISIKNESTINIQIIYTNDSVINDQDLFYRSKYSIKSGTTSEIKSLGIPDNKFYLFVFAEDSVDRFLKEGRIDGILKKSFLNRYTLSMDSLKNDTFIFKN